MATIQHRSYDKTVANIPERNAISPRRPGMTVLVRDAIGDPYAGSGRAVYRWDEVQASWILMFKDNVETLTFTGESKTISQDQIQLSFVPANGQVWDVMVRDGLVAHQVEHSVAGSVVTIQPDTPGQFDGKQLSVRYAYGTMTQQLDLEIARVVGEAVGVFDKEALGLGNVDNTSDLNKPLSTAAQTALAGKSDTGHTHAEVTTSAAGFMSAADKTKLDGVEDGANNYAHPASHPASIITQDAENRFVTDAEKTAWNSKEASGTAAAAMTAHTSAADPHGQYLPKAGGTMSGPISFAPAQTWPTFNQSTTGNAGTATKLATARTLTVGNTVKAFDGSEDLTWTLAEIGATGLQYLTEVRGTAAPNATVPVHGVRATGTEANIDLVLQPKGSGAIVAVVPDGSASNGTKRGQNSVDFQRSRNSSAHVAYGNNSVICGGEYNTANGASSAIGGGANNTANGSYSAIGGGYYNVANGSGSTVGGGSGNVTNGGGATVGGGDGNTANGSRSTIPGGMYATTNSLLGLLAYGFSGEVSGRNQMSFWGGRAATTTGTPTRITADAGAASATNQLTLRNNSAFRVRGTVVARDTSANYAKEWTFEALIKRGATAADTAIVGTPSITSTFADTAAAGRGIAVTADTTNGALAITATGVVSTTIRWTAVVHSIEVA